MDKCEQCKFYTAYYEKATVKYLNSLKGKCRKHNKIVSRCKSCECFQQRPKPKKSIDFTIDRLNELFDDLMAIRQILEEKFKDLSD